jgi:uncharacterized RDD family membrane protein YckC
VLSVTTLSTTHYSAVTPMFRGCYGMGSPGQSTAFVSRYAGAVVDRKDFSSWLEGPRARTSAQEEYRGRDLGLPPSGPGSIAGFGIRLVGVLIDWGIAALIARGIFSVPLPFAQPPATGGQNFVVLGVFTVMHLLLVGTIGYTIGHRIVGLQVQSLGGARVMPVQAVVRTILLCLFIPAVVWDRDGRGLHDKVPGTVIVRTR